MLSRRAGPMPSPMQYAASPMLRSEYYGEMPQQLQQFHNVISGSVTTVPIEGQSSSAIQVFFFSFNISDYSLTTHHW